MPDAVGNRLSETRPAGTTTYSYNAADQLLTATGPAGTATYTFDANGNETGDGTRSFVYDLANRLTTATVGAQTTSYGYDGDGTRLSAQGVSTVNYLWDPNAALPLLALERDAGGTTPRRYAYGSGLLGMRTGGAEDWYLSDMLGSVANLTNSTGSLEWSYSYEPYGTIRTEIENDPAAPFNPIRFTGQYLDTDTGLYHLRARQYDSTAGRFLQVDPLGTAADPYGSLYRYTENNPIAHLDPSGLDSDESGCGAGFGCWFIPVRALAQYVASEGSHLPDVMMDDVR